MAAAPVPGGCASRYQELEPAGGVRASEMTDDVRRISGRGNAPTEAATVRDFVLFEAAETTLAAGGTHFVIVGMEDVGPARAGRQTGLHAFGGAGGREGGRSTPDMVGVSRVAPDGPSGEDVTIRVLGAEATPEEKAEALDAAQLVSDVGPRLKRPGAPDAPGAAPSSPEAVTAPDGKP